MDRSEHGVVDLSCGAAFAPNSAVSLAWPNDNCDAGNDLYPNNARCDLRELLPTEFGEGCGHQLPNHRDSGKREAEVSPWFIHVSLLRL